MPATLEILESTIVVIGSFNPAIFSPDWLAHNKLIGKDDAKSASSNESLIISRQVAVVETDGFILQVLENKFSLASKGAVTPMMKDLAVGIMTVIPQTPVIAVGLNFIGHYKFTTRAEYHRIGDVFAPKHIWKTIFPDGALGLANLSIKIQPCERDETPKTGDELNIIVLPSTKIRGGGILFNYNDHKDIVSLKDESTTSAEWAAILIDKEWDTSRNRSVEVFDGLINSALAEKTV